MLGTIEHHRKFNKTLPFMLKILSVAQPLSLQSHPDKKLAQILHNRDPKNYPDSNHKPELTIALTEFEMLCDFRPTKEISHFLNLVTPLRRIIGEKKCQSFCKAASEKNELESKQALAECFEALLICQKENIAHEVKNLFSSTEICSVLDSDLLILVRDLDKLYPGDAGIFAPFLLNHFKLAPGQAVFVNANKLHAYIKGDCIECMACSDNVVRAGLTTKFRDVDTLIKMLDYKSVKDYRDLLLTGSKHSNKPTITTYAPSDEFKIDNIIINETSASEGEYTLDPLSSASFIVVITGQARARNFLNLDTEHKLGLGSAAFVPPKTSLKFYSIQGTLAMYRSYC